MPIKKPVLIVEHCQSGMKLNEKVSNKKKSLVLDGVFTEFDKKNRNDRIYEANDFIPHLNELMDRKKKLGVIYGEWDHPETFDTSLARVSHVVENCWFNKNQNRIDGEIVLLNTHWGKEAQSIVEQGYPIFVSSRAAGITEGNKVKLKKLFTYDAVADPGFDSTRMSVKNINESIGFNDESSFRVIPATEKQLKREFHRIFNLSDESKTNELFEMNKSDFVTKKQMSEYSQHLVKEITDTKQQIDNLMRKKNVDGKNVKELENLQGYFEELQNQNQKVVKYLDYLAEKVQVAVDGYGKLEKKQNEMIDYSNYIAENVNKSIEYSEYIAENVEKNIDYSNYLAENLDKSINYSNYIAENLDKSIDYSEYLAENLDASIDYSEYIAENVDKSIDYAEYIAENVDKNIKYSEYLAENLDANIDYSEYIAENLDANIGYNEYIAENLEKAIKYSEYVAECADNTMSYAGKIRDRVEGGKVNESKDEDGKLPTPKKFLKQIKEQKLQDMMKPDEQHKDDKMNNLYHDSKEIGDSKKQKKMGSVEQALDLEKHKDTYDATVEDEDVAMDKFKKASKNVSEKAKTKASLTDKIDQLLSEAKKREASEEDDPHFYKFLKRNEIKAFESLDQEDQELIKVHMKDVSYYSNQDVLKEMRSVMAQKEASPEEKLLKHMPEELEPVWESLDNKQKNAIIAQSKFHVFESEEAYENFWSTRKLKMRSLNESKKTVHKDELKIEDSLSEEQVASFMERINYDV